MLGGYGHLWVLDIYLHIGVSCDIQERKKIYSRLSIFNIAQTMVPLPISHYCSSSSILDLCYTDVFSFTQRYRCFHPPFTPKEDRFDNRRN